MSEHSQHTPGPWTFDPKRPDVITVARKEGGQYVVGHALMKLERRVEGEWQANARLIAAAPEMLAALNAIIDASDKCQGHRNCAHDMTGWQLARAAIAKATGGNDNSTGMGHK